MSKYEKFEESSSGAAEVVVQVEQPDLSAAIIPIKTTEVVVEENGFSNPLAFASSAANNTAHSNGQVHSRSHSRSSSSGNNRIEDDVKFDQIQIALVEDKGTSEPSEVLVNAADFFLEHNDNYTLSWDEASHQISEVDEDPSKPPVPGMNWPYIRWRLRRGIESIWFRTFTLALILFDLIIVIIDLATHPEDGSFTTLQLIDLLVTIYFVLEIFLRIAALEPPYFFSAWYNVVDFAVVLITLIIVIVAATGTKWAEALTIITALRFVRIFRLIRLYTEKQQIETAVRQMVSQNKRRYQQDGHDLDLTYVTARIIATSFPSSGVWAIYRNPIEKVAAFLDSKHPSKYKLYNLCSERTYDPKHFHDRVERFMIDDHNVPSLKDMLGFAQNVRDWLNADSENVIVVHCKGGKGRTGTMICLWLVEAGVFSTAGQSLEYFGQRRTDTNVSKKFQGVETPSQSRYVGYYETMRNQLGGCLPQSRPLVIKSMTLRGMMYVGQGNGDDFWFNVDQGRGNQVFSGHIGFRRNVDAVEYDPLRDVLQLQVLNCPSLDGDTRVLFQTASKTVPKGYEKCPFYFWFNTAFIPKVGDDLKLVLTREELDNPHKSKTWHCFRESFSVEVMFAEAPATATTQS